jgi:hypothetical protein
VAQGRSQTPQTPLCYQPCPEPEPHWTFWARAWRLAAGKDTRTPEYMEKSGGIGTVPMIEDDGFHLLESHAILTVRARLGRLSALSVSVSKSGLYGAFVWVRRALNRPKRRFPARAVPRGEVRRLGAVPGRAANSRGPNLQHHHTITIPSTKDEPPSSSTGLVTQGVLGSFAPHLSIGRPPCAQPPHWSAYSSRRRVGRPVGLVGEYIS